jgi:hypothetical protein
MKRFYPVKRKYAKKTYTQFTKNPTQANYKRMMATNFGGRVKK